MAAIRVIYVRGHTLAGLAIRHHDDGTARRGAGRAACTSLASKRQRDRNGATMRQIWRLLTSEA